MFVIDLPKPGKPGMIIRRLNTSNTDTMKEKLLTSLFIGLFAMSALDVRAQSNTPPAKVEIPNTQLLKLTSAVVSQEYQLFIHKRSLPERSL